MQHWILSSTKKVRQACRSTPPPAPIFLLLLSPSTTSALILIIDCACSRKCSQGRGKEASVFLAASQDCCYRVYRTENQSIWRFVLSEVHPRLLCGTQAAPILFCKLRVIIANHGFAQDEDRNYKLPLDEVNTIKQELIGLMIACPPAFQTQLGEATSIVADSDFWDRWDTLVQVLWLLPQRGWTLFLT